jgi:L-cysteine/cystine lyase
MQADPKVKLARDGIPVVNECAYLDTASVGPVSKIFCRTLAENTEQDLRLGRARLERFERADKARERIRDEISELLAVGADRLELTDGTTSGIRAVISRFPWQSGDEILTTPLEFPRCMEPLHELTRQQNIRLHTVNVPREDTDDIGWLANAITPKTRMIFCSGVAYGTGQKLPIDRIARFASTHGIYTLVDGAQSVGAVMLDLSTTPVDFLAMPLQKWLGGPEGLGALYVRSSTLDLLRPDSVVHGWPVLEATGEHLSWLRKTLGWPWIFERTGKSCRYARNAISNVDPDRLITPEHCAGIVAIRASDGDGQALFDRLCAANLLVRYRPELGLFRISTAFFVSNSDIDRFMEFIQ